MDERRFVEGLIAAVPEAFAEPDDLEHYLGDEPLSYPALGAARSWLEDHALEISGLFRPHAAKPGAGRRVAPTGSAGAEAGRYVVSPCARSVTGCHARHVARRSA